MGIVHLVGFLAVKRPMRPGLIVERQVVRQALVGRIDGVVGMQIDLLVFNALPQSLHEHVVSPPPFSVHADLDAMVGEHPRELLARELAPLVRIEDGRSAIWGDGRLHRIQTEVGSQRVGQPPRQDPTTRPVEHHKEIHKASAHRNVGDIGGPDMIGPRDGEIPQEIGVNRMGRMPPAERRLLIQGLNPHTTHQGDHVTPPDGVALVP